MTATKIKSLASFCEASHLDSSLVRAVVDQFGGWEDFERQAKDVTDHGIDGGFHGFIYHADTEPFARRNRSAIAAMASKQANEFGTSITEMIQGFCCFRNGHKPTDEEIGRALYAGKNLEDGVNVLNALAWYAGEEVCRSFCDLTGAND